ncbi:MAG: DUF4838 domain-containing protein [Planctomycetota bacterium]|nr:DUF4838 domain-containing protein [Planctomycetota bacterium]
MKPVLALLTALLLAPLAAKSADTPEPKVLDRQWVAAGSNGKLEYKTTPKGDRIMDFSYAGYMGGGVALPTLPVKKEVAPSGGDNTAVIQAAIDEVSALPLVDGFRGAVLLKPGTFRCSKQITLMHDGVVVRGSGSGEKGTLIEMTGEPQVAFELAEVLGRITGGEFDVRAVGAEWIRAANKHNSEFGVESPRGVAVDAAGRLYVVEGGSPGTITVFNANGTGREVVRLEPTGAVHWPFGIDVATNGDVAVAVRTAAGKGQIQFFDQKNRFLSRLNLDEYGGCADLAFDADGNLWVTSEGDFQVRQFARTGRLLLTVPNRPGLRRDHWYLPSGIDVDSKGRVLVSDYYNVVRFDPADYAKTMELFAGLPGSENGRGNGEFGAGIGGIDIDRKGNVYVADRGNSRVQVFDSDGKFLRVVDNRRIDKPDDLAVDSDGDVYVASGSGDTSAVYRFLADPLTQLPEKAIVVGTIDDFPQVQDQGIADALKIGPYFDGVEAYAIRTTDSRVLLLGAKPLGVSHAASAFLERLGYRMYFPSQNWEVVPSIPTLRADMNVSDRPDYLAYMALYGFGAFPDDGGRDMADYDRWMRRNRKGMSLPVMAGHSWQQIIIDNQAEFDAHPEYFALVDGKRDVQAVQIGTPKLCVSNPELIKLCKRWARKYFEDNPREEMVSMDPSDYNGPDGNCQCEKCNAIGKGTSSDKVFFLANEVAREVAPQGKMVGLLAYEHHSDVPSFKLEDNVYVQLTRIFIRGEHSYDQLITEWQNKAMAMGHYDYWSVFHWFEDMHPSRYGNNVEYLTTSIRNWHAHGGRSLNPEITNGWGVHGRGLYLAAHLRWHVDMDVDAFLDDFYRRAFGPAGESMKAYYERLDWSRFPVFNDHIVALAYRDLERATEQATGHPDVLARIDDLKIYMHYFHLKWQFDHEQDAAAREKIALQLLRHVCRSRMSYMVDWAWLSKWWIGKITNWDPRGKVGDAAAWAYTNPDAPWRDNTPYTREEIEAFFQQELKNWQPKTNLVEREFSDDVVAVQFADYGKEDATQYAIFQGDGVVTLKYGLYSVGGEPFNFTFSTGIYYTDKPPLYYSLSDTDGKVITSGSIRHDRQKGQKHQVTLEVPRAGQYELEVQDNASGWGINAQRDTPMSIRIQGRGHNHQGTQR